MNRLSAFLLVMISIGALGYAHGRLTDRWGMPAEVSQAAERLALVPHEINGWVGTDLPIGTRQLEAASAEGSLSRQYMHSETGEVVQVMILCGRPGPIAVHPPTVCFVGSGVEQATEESKATLSSGETESEFFTADFVQTDLFEEAQRTYWAWSTTGRSWSAPGDSQTTRLTFAGEPYLYKMYFTTPVERLPGQEEFAPTSENVLNFMEAMLRLLPQSLNPDEA